jgi:hypothetical protein
MKQPVFILGFLLVVASAQAQTAVQAWVQRYNGPGNYSDVAADIAVDNNGNVFVTGYSYDGYPDYATIAYSNTGTPLWTNRYSGPGFSDSASAIAVNSDGNVFVTGFSENSQTYPYNRDYATVAYSGAGIPLWTNRYNGTGNDDDQATAITTSTNGNVFVTGWSSRGGANYDYVTIAYSSAGIPLWTNRYNGPGNGIDRASAIATDRNGNVFVTGYSTGSGSGNDYATIAYSNAGIPLWTNRYNESGTYDDEATAITVDTNGNVFVTGYSGIGAKTDLDYATIAYSNAGVPLWTNRYNGPGSSIDAASAIAIDGSGNVFVTGGASNGTNNDYLTIAYSNSGVPLWTNRYNGPGNKDDAARAIAVDISGNVFVTGGASDGINSDYVTIAYSNTGVPLWTNRYNGSGNNIDVVFAIAVDRRGNVFVTGESMGSVGFFDYVTIKYSVAQSIPLNIQKVENQLVLSWTNASFSLQSASAISGTFTNVPGATSPYTNFISGLQQYFRLISN